MDVKKIDTLITLYEKRVSTLKNLKSLIDWTVPGCPCGGYPINRNSGILETSAFSTMNFSRSWDPCLTTRN